MVCLKLCCHNWLTPTPTYLLSKFVSNLYDCALGVDNCKKIHLISDLSILEQDLQEAFIVYGERVV